MTRSVAIWGGLAAVVIIPLWLAALSPLLAWREPAYIVAGFAGILGLIAILFQPLLAGRVLPNLTPIQQHRFHRSLGIFLTFTVIIHVAGLWITSPPDVIDALLFASPTPFSIWGVIAMWAVFAAALMAGLRHRLRRMIWQRMHKTLAVVIVSGTVLHALLIQGTMETWSKAALCMIVVAATGWVIGIRGR